MVRGHEVGVTIAIEVRRDQTIRLVAARVGHAFTESPSSGIVPDSERARGLAHDRKVLITVAIDVEAKWFARQIPYRERSLHLGERARPIVEVPGEAGWN